MRSSKVQRCSKTRASAAATARLMHCLLGWAKAALQARGSLSPAACYMHLCCCPHVFQSCWLHATRLKPCHWPQVPHLQQVRLLPAVAVVKWPA